MDSSFLNIDTILTLYNLTHFILCHCIIHSHNCIIHSHNKFKLGTKHIKKKKKKKKKEGPTWAICYRVNPSYTNALGPTYYCWKQELLCQCNIEMDRSSWSRHFSLLSHQRRPEMAWNNVRDLGRLVRIGWLALVYHMSAEFWHI